jgi:hypothetical protein
MKSEKEIGRLGEERRMVYGIPPLGRQQSSSRKKAKRNFSQNQNLPRHLKRQCLQDTNFEEIRTQD